MTTIAVKDGVLAVDSLINSNGTICGETTKFWTDGVKAAAGAGDIQDVIRFLKWVKEGEGSCEGSFCGVVWDGNKIYHIDGKEVKYEVRAPFHAWGTGMDLAMGAMAAGATAEEAVKIAAQYDCYTGGEIHVIKLEKAP